MYIFTVPNFTIKAKPLNITSVIICFFEKGFVCTIIIVPSISSLEAQPTTSETVTLLWTIPEGDIIDNYTLTVTRLCDNVMFIQSNISDAFNHISIGLSSGLQYTVGIIPLNLLGTGMESNVNVTVMEGTGKLLYSIHLTVMSVSLYRSSQWCSCVTSTSHY